MRRYETIFILRSNLGEAQTRETISRFEGIVSAGGELIETDEWGQRELAYRIRGERRGVYVRLDYVAPGTTTTELERNLKLTDSVIRYLSVMVEPEADIAKARAEAEARRQHRAAAAQPKPAEAETGETPVAETGTSAGAVSAPAATEAVEAAAAKTESAPSGETPAGEASAAPAETAEPAQSAEPESGGQPN